MQIVKLCCEDIRRVCSIPPARLGGVLGRAPSSPLGWLWVQTPAFGTFLLPNVCAHFFRHPFPWRKYVSKILVREKNKSEVERKRKSDFERGDRKECRKKKKKDREKSKINFLGKVPFSPTAHSLKASVIPTILYTHACSALLFIRFHERRTGVFSFFMGDLPHRSVSFHRCPLLVWLSVSVIKQQFSVWELIHSFIKQANSVYWSSL